jgi:ABC-type multidrug transport system fused ATPase/permease subunit/thiamine kinase-like enzyme
LNKKGIDVSNHTQARKLPKNATADKPVRKQSEFRRVIGLLGRFVSRQRAPFILAFVMLLIEVLSDLGSKYTVPYLLDYLKGDKPEPLLALGLPYTLGLMGTVALLLGGFVILAMINSSSDSASEIFLARGGRMMGYNLRVALYSHLQRLSLAFYNKQRTGDLLTRVTGDVTAIEEFVTRSLSDMIGGILLLIGSLVALFLSDVRIGLLAMIVVPPLALVSNYFSQRVKATAKKVRAHEGDLAAGAQEMLSSIRVIQTYGRAGNQEQRFAEQSNKTMKVALEAARIEAQFSFAIKVMEAVATVGVIAAGVWLSGQGLITVGQLVLFFALIDGMFKPTKKIIKEWNSVGKVYASVERIGDLLDRKPAVFDQPTAIAAPTLQGNIEYRNVSFAYQAESDTNDKQEAALRLALRDVSFSIAPGEVVALVGGSGAGKSTVVQLLPRLYDPHAGQILIDGHDIREFTLDSLRAQLSTVLQEAILFTGSIAENISYGREKASRDDVIAAAMQANAHEFIEKLPEGYDTVLGERASTLSGGQRQRIAIARAFIRNTPILILDEPTTGLDAESTELVLLALRSLMKGKATVIISHDLNLIRHADKIVVIKQGEVIQQGNHKELLRIGGLYAELYHKQFGEAMGEQGRQIEQPLITAAPALDLDDEDADPVTPKVFQTLIGKALPQPVTPKAFQTLMMQALPSPAAPAEAALPAPTKAAPAAPPPSPGVPAVNPVPATPTSAPKPAVPQAVKPMPLPTPVPSNPPEEKTDAKPRPAIFETTVMRTIPEPAAKADAHEPIQASGTQARAPRSLPNASTWLDALHSPVLQAELPNLATAFDGEAMRGYLQLALFGKSHTQHRIERCTPGKAIYTGDICTLRYELVVKETSSGQTFQPLVVGRMFQDQLACAQYMRDKLLPLARLMRDRPEIAPLTAPVAMIEPLNMVVHAFPIDGELPTLVGATDRQRVTEILTETLPEVQTGQLTIQDIRIIPVNYARRYRCVMRYEIECLAPDNQLQHREVYGKVATDTQGALIAPVIAALRKRVQGDLSQYQFNIPRSLGFRPDLQLSLLEAIPGTPQINQLLKARLSGADLSTGELTLDRALDACAQIANALHRSNIGLGRRRTLDDELIGLRKGIREVQRISPELGAQFQTWLERIESYAEESDALLPRFCHGDYTYAQVIFDGQHSGLVDFDTVCQAEPALDLGQFLAYLRAAAHKAHKTTSPGATPIGVQLGEHFLDTYIVAAGEHIEDAERLRIRASVYEVVSLMRMALHSWQQLKATRLENAIAVLEEAMVRLPQLDY